MAFDRAKEHLKKYNLEDKIIVFNQSSATVSDAALAANTEEKNIAKTLSFMVNERPILVCVSGDKKIDNSKFKKEFGIRGTMLQYDMVEKLIGHAVGGVCPFGINENVDVYLDVSLKDLDVMYPACGSGNSAVKLNINELELSSNYIRYVDICK